jgi:hypothetical protein
LSLPVLSVNFAVPPERDTLPSCVRPSSSVKPYSTGNDVLKRPAFVVG